MTTARRTGDETVLPITKRRLAGAATALVLTLLINTMAACNRGDHLPWSDDFDSPDSGWQAETDASAEVSYADGTMRILVYWADRYAWALAQRSFSDYHLRVEASQVAGPDDNEYGVLARVQDKRHMYRFAISGDGYFQVVKLDGGQETLLTDEWTVSNAIQTGAATNVIEITCQGSRMTFRVNGVVLAEVEDKSYKTGDVGLYAGTFHDPGDGVEIHFDNLSISLP